MVAPWNLSTQYKIKFLSNFISSNLHPHIVLNMSGSKSGLLDPSFRGGWSHFSRRKVDPLVLAPKWCLL
jgi:hypothetical protein